MSAFEPWVIFCDHDRVEWEQSRPCSAVWVARALLANEWHARLIASREGWRHKEFDPISTRNPRDFCPEHADDATDLEPEAAA